MIKGIGIDIADIQRFRKIEHDTVFQSEVFTRTETEAVAGNPGQVFAFARMFATKEAALKALGRGLYFGSSWKDMETLSDARVHIPTGALRRESRPNLRTCRSSSKNHAIAFVVLE